jgi:CRP-like cAMP-binding protein
MAYRNHLLALLPAESLARLEPYLVREDLPAGRVLFKQGDAIEHTYFIEEGAVAYFTRMQDGGRVQSLSIGHEGAVGLTGSIGIGRMLREVAVQISGHALKIERRYIAESFLRNPSVRRVMGGYSATQMSQLLQLVACNARHSVEQRLARWLLECRDRVGNRPLTFRHEELAEILGVQRTTVTPIARALQAQGLIRYHRGVIEILNAEGIERTACGCRRAIKEAFDIYLPSPAPG